MNKPQNLQEKKSMKTINYIISNIELKREKVLTTVKGNLFQEIQQFV